MLGYTIGLHIGAGTLVAVKVNQTLRGNRVTDCATVELDETGLPAALLRLDGRMDLKGSVCHCAIGAERVSFRNLSLPFHDAKKIRQTLPFELETISPFPVEELLVDFTVIGRHDGQTGVLAASVRRSFLTGLLADLTAARLDPEIIEVGYAPLAAALPQIPEMAESALVLALEESGATVLFFTGRRLALVRGLPLATVRSGEDDPEGAGENAAMPAEAVATFCRAVRQTLHAFLAEHPALDRPEKIYLTGAVATSGEVRDLVSRELELDAELIDFSRQAGIQVDEGLADRWRPQVMDGALALAVRGGRPPSGFNFRRDAFAISTRLERFGKEIRGAAVYLVLILALLGADLGVEYRSLLKRNEALDRQLAESFKEIFPEVTRVVDPVRQMQVRMRELKESAVASPGIASNAKVIDLLEDISQRIPAEVSVRMTRLVVDQESLLLTGTTDTFNSVDAIKKGLEDSEFFDTVAIASANLDRSGQGVLFELRLQRSKS